jgi:hypothetical protein
MQPATAFTRLPETLTAPEIGVEMARLRAQFGLTPQEVSERLHIRPRYIAAIEEGKLELMPGKVYARGYVHTYAEFLGLDGAQIVGLCFAGEPPANAQTIPLPPLKARGVTPRQSRRLVVVGVAALAVLVLASQWLGEQPDTSATQPQSRVAPVPSAMLAQLRVQVMPVASNRECLLGASALGCTLNDGTVQVIRALSAPLILPWAEPIDVSDLTLETADEDAADPAPSESAEADE